MDAGSRIRQFIRAEILFDEDPSALADDTVLLEGAMDSLGLMQLVAFLEEEFGIEIDEADVTAHHFRTVADIERLVAAKLDGHS